MSSSGTVTVKFEGWDCTDDSNDVQDYYSQCRGCFCWPNPELEGKLQCEDCSYCESYTAELYGYAAQATSWCTDIQSKYVVDPYTYVTLSTYSSYYCSTTAFDGGYQCDDCQCSQATNNDTQSCEDCKYCDAPSTEVHNSSYMTIDKVHCENVHASYPNNEGVYVYSANECDLDASNYQARVCNDCTCYSNPFGKYDCWDCQCEPEETDPVPDTEPVPADTSVMKPSIFCQYPWKQVRMDETGIVYPEYSSSMCYETYPVDVATDSYSMCNDCQCEESTAASTSTTGEPMWHCQECSWCEE